MPAPTNIRLKVKHPDGTEFTAELEDITYWEAETEYPALMDDLETRLLNIMGKAKE